MLLHAAAFLPLVLRSRDVTLSGRAGDAVLLVGVTGGTQNRDASPASEAGTGQKAEGKPRQGGLHSGTKSQLMNAVEYPEEAVAMELEGIVEIEADIGPDGQTRGAAVVRSSGHRILDEAARTGVLRWTFTDAENTRTKIKFRFRLK